MDSKFHVSYEAARLLKEKGYDEECFSYYYDDGKEIDYSFCGGERNSTWEERCVSAPTKAEAIDWLESKGIVIEISFVRNGKWRYSLYKGDKFYWDSWVHDRIDFQTRLEAEDAAIKQGCKLLKR